MDIANGAASDVIIVGGPPGQVVGPHTGGSQQDKPERIRSDAVHASIKVVLFGNLR